MVWRGGEIGRRRARPLVVTIVVLLVVLLLCGAVGCGPHTVPPPVSPPAPPATPTTPTPPTPPPVPPAPPRPEPWAGTGLAEPYITREGNLELTFADARGTLTVNAKGTKVATAALSPDRLKLAYATEAGSLLVSQVLVVDATVTPWQQRELSSAATDVSCELSWSPCGQYMLIDSGTAFTRGWFVVDVDADVLVAALGGCGRGWAWSQGQPTRLAVTEVSRRPTVPVTELEEMVDLVIVDLPSGRSSLVAAGTASAYWSHPEWLGSDRLRAVLTPLGDPERATTAEFAAPPVKSGPIPPVDLSPLSGGGITAEVSELGELLVANGEGAVVRRLTDRQSGGVGDVAVSNDGKYLAYTWVDEDFYNHSTLVVVSLPDLTQRVIDDSVFSRPFFGSLSAAPGGQPLVLYQDEAGELLVIDLDSGQVIWRGRGTGALWLGAPVGPPAFVVGLAETTPPREGYGLIELSLAVVRPLNGTVTVVRAAPDGAGYWPIRFLDGGARVECVRVTGRF